jgi:predicted outer membrane repeat protein
MKRLAAFSFALGMLLLLAPVPSVRAAMFTIANGDVPGLIAALATANGNNEDDVIQLAAGGTYTLTAVDDMVSGMNGLPSIAPDGGHTVTINGGAAAIERDTLAPQFRLFHVQVGATLMLSSVSLVGGDVVGLGFPANAGAAISNAGMTTLSGVTVSDHAGDDGGAIFNSGTMIISLSLIEMNAGNNGTVNNNVSGSLSISQSTFNDNDAVLGGAILSIGNAALMVTDSAFNRNRALGDPGSRGGAIDAFPGLVTLSNVRFSENSATDAGGAISVRPGATVNMTGGFVRMSSNSGASAAIHNEGTLTIDGTDVSDNFRGIRNDSSIPGSVAELHVENSTIVNNGASGISNAAGSGMMMATHTANVTVLNTTLAGHGTYAISSIAFSNAATSTVSLTVADSRITGNGGIESHADDPGETATATIVNTEVVLTGFLNGLDVEADGAGTSASTIVVGSTFAGGTGTGVSHVATQTATSLLRLTNSTVSGSADGVAQFGFALSLPALELRNVTITDSSDIGLTNDGGLVEAYNVIVANSGTKNCELLSGSYGVPSANLSDDPSCVGSLGFSEVPDMRLGALRDNGGPTRTHRLLGGSPAIDAGEDARCAELVDADGLPLTTDQRGPGFPRTIGPHCDVGAFELDPAIPAPALGLAGLSLAVGLLLLSARRALAPRLPE